MEAIAPLLLAVIIFVPFYLMIVRPHRQRLAEHDEIVAALPEAWRQTTADGQIKRNRERDEFLQKLRDIRDRKD